MRTFGRVLCQQCDSADLRRAFGDHRNRLAEFDSFLNAYRPKSIAWHAVSFDRIATAEQSHQVRDRKRVLWLFALAAWACRYEDNGLSHGANPFFLTCASKAYRANSE
jgi:hypothetical protein